MKPSSQKKSKKKPDKARRDIDNLKAIYDELNQDLASQIIAVENLRNQLDRLRQAVGNLETALGTIQSSISAEAIRRENIVKALMGLVSSSDNRLCR
jgi:chromosome segregation ATPase